MTIPTDTKQRLLEAAGPIFAEKGYGGATVREICDAARVNLAAVSYHFGDKRNLYLATVEYAREWLNERHPIQKLDPALAPELRLGLLIRRILNRFLGANSGTWHLKLLNREVINPTAACEQLIKQHFRRRFEELMALIDELGGPGLPEHEQEQLAFAVMGQCFHYLIAGKFVGLMTKESGTQAHYSLESLANHITRFTLAGITHWKSVSIDLSAAVPSSLPVPNHAFDPASASLTEFAEEAWPYELNGSKPDDA